MNRLLRLFPVLGAMLHCALHAAPAELDILRQQYEALVAERVTAPHETAVAELNAKFTAALDHAIATAKQAGSLPTVLALEEDKKRLAEKIGLPIDTEETPEVLVKLRAIYRGQFNALATQRNTNLAELLVPYTARLSELEATLTKADRVAEATQVMEYRTGLLAAPTPTPAASLPAPLPATVMPAAPAGAPKDKGDDRKAAEWVLSVGGSVEIWEGPVTSRKVAALADLPGGQLSLKAVVLNNQRGGIQPVTDADLLVLGGLQRLESVTLHKLRITPAAFDVFQACPRLKLLNLQYNSLGDGIWARLAGHPSLLHVGHGYDALPVNGLGISVLNPRTTEVLHLASSTITDAGLAEIGQLPNLRILGLEATSITDAGMPALAALKNLTELLVHGTAVTVTGIASVEAAPIVRLGYGRNMEDFLSPLPEIAARFPKLRQVHLPRDVNPNPADWDRIAKALPKLTEVYVRSFKFSDAACAGLESLAVLDKLALAYAPVTDAGVVEIAKLKKLRFLEIPDAKITDAALHTISESRNLKILTLPKPGNGLTAAGIDALKKRRPDIEFR